MVRSLSALIVSALARVEVPAALWRKHRTAELDAKEASFLARFFAADLGDDGSPPRFAVVSVGRPLLEQATGFVATHGLRAYDAVQLSSAVAARTVDPQCQSFACFDRELRGAAATHGFRLTPEAL